MISSDFLKSNIWKILFYSYILYTIIFIVYIIIDYKHISSPFVTTYIEVFITLLLLISPILIGYNFGKIHHIENNRNKILKYICVVLLLFCVLESIYIMFLLYLSVGTYNTYSELDYSFIIFMLFVFYVPLILSYEIGKN